MTGKRVDRRRERWREHRIEVRAQFIDAAFRALDALGPDVSMGDIAREAGAAKPKLYRHFEDKTDLYGAIVDRMQELVRARILGNIDLTTDSTAVVTGRSATEYAHVVAEHPNVFRFLVHGHFTQQADESERALGSARRSARNIAAFLVDLAGADSIDAQGAELVAYTVFGAVASATDWWLGIDRRDIPTMAVDRFADYLVTIVSAIATATANQNGIAIDPDQPLHLAFRASAAHRRE